MGDEFLRRHECGVCHENQYWEWLSKCDYCGIRACNGEGDSNPKCMGASEYGRWCNEDESCWLKAHPDAQRDATAAAPFTGDDDDDDDDDDCPSCNKCGDSDDVSDPGGDYYWCSHCGHDIDSDGDCVTSDCSTCDDDDDDDDDSESCPWCGDEAFLCTQDDDYEGQRIYTCCSVYFDEDGDLWPADNPMGEGLCRSCGTNEHADDCSKELCGRCCDGDCGCDRHE